MRRETDVRVYTSLPRAKLLLVGAAIPSLTLGLLFFTLFRDRVGKASGLDPEGLVYLAGALFLWILALVCLRLAFRRLVTDERGITLAMGPVKRRIPWAAVRHAGVGRFSIVLNLERDRTVRVFLPAEGFGRPEERLRMRNRLLSDIYGRIGEPVVAQGHLGRPISDRERRGLQEQAVAIARAVAEFPVPALPFEQLVEVWKKGGDDPAFEELLDRWFEAPGGSDSPEERMRALARLIVETWGSSG